MSNDVYKAPAVPARLFHSSAKYKDKFYGPIIFDPTLRAEGGRITHIPATNPRPEYGAQSGPSGY